MKVLKIAECVILFLFFVIAAFIGGKHVQKVKDNTLSQIDTSIYYDTILIQIPVPRDSVVIKYIVEKLPIYDTLHIYDTIADSIAVYIPIYQYHFQDSTYNLYASGYKVNIDSLIVYPKTTIINKPYEIQVPVKESIFKPKFSLGVQLGATYMDNGIKPYLGIGISYNFINF